MPTPSVLAAIAWEPADGELFYFRTIVAPGNLPTMTTAEVLKACAEEAKLPFLVIGGHAVILYGYQRNTADLDVLIRRSDLDAWVNVLGTIHYAPICIHQTFAQFESKAGSIDLDLMFVSDETFEKMSAQSKVTQFGETSVRIPSIEHLIALKLHALKQDLSHRRILDFDDVTNLVLKNGIKLEESRWREIFEKHGTLDWYERIRKATRA